MDMDKDKEYIPPKCVDLSSGSIGKAKGQPCVIGSVPGGEDPCWNGGTPPYEECAEGSTPAGGCGPGTAPSP